MLTPEKAKQDFLSLTDMFGETFIVFMPFTFYCDETGTDRRSKWVGIVGYISSRDRWAEFCKEWQVVLDKTRVQFLHFSGLPTILPKDVKFEPLVTECADIISRNTVAGIGVFVEKDAYEKKMPDWYKQCVKLPEMFCLEQFLKIAFGEAEEHSFLSDKAPVSFVFDHVCSKSNPDWYRGIHRIYSHLKEKDNALGLIGCLTIDSKSGKTPHAKPLQGVDCLACHMETILYDPASYAVSVKKPKQKETEVDFESVRLWLKIIHKCLFIFTPRFERTVFKAIRTLFATAAIFAAIVIGVSLCVYLADCFGYLPDGATSQPQSFEDVLSQWEKWRRYWIFVFYAVGGLLLLAISSIILILTAIERNTRAQKTK